MAVRLIILANKRPFTTRYNAICDYLTCEKNDSKIKKLTVNAVPFLMRFVIVKSIFWKWLQWLKLLIYIRNYVFLLWPVCIMYINGNFVIEIVRVLLSC